MLLNQNPTLPLSPAQSKADPARLAPALPHSASPSIELVILSARLTILAIDSVKFPDLTRLCCRPEAQPSGAAHRTPHSYEWTMKSPAAPQWPRPKRTSPLRHV